MGLQWEAVVVNAADPTALGRWWAEALGWGAVTDADGDVHIRPRADSHPEILFVAVPDRKQIPNRLHLDFRPDDQQAEVERLLALGARHADVGQGEQSWVVLADPEGNEFCVLSGRP
ncbi:VOC family protein [Rhodococcus sp. T2V]|uniref:VOC family protein n=1 Tax=Rhodococcus sp. T2V TaxID=3034164 RepID=UPI0023E0AB6A|nr:VOC family protein [Rhodococcus sp. T2V]MDF3305524.1 VOC family protein [Rhodococcus sp. T2V]